MPDVCAEITGGSFWNETEVLLQRECGEPLLLRAQASTCMVRWMGDGGIFLLEHPEWVRRIMLEPKHRRGGGGLEMRGQAESVYWLVQSSRMIVASPTYEWYGTYLK